MDRVYDFSPLDSPMTAAESAARRRAMLGGRSILRELDFVRGMLLIGMVVMVWPALLLVGGTTIAFIINWVFRNGPTADWGAGTPLLLLAILVAVAVVVIATRLLVIPPAWGRWARMHRFAEVNGLSFLRRVTRSELPSAPVGGVGGAGAQLLFDVFSDPVAGIVLGNAGAGAGAQAFVLAQPDGAGLEALDVEPVTGFTVRETPEGRLATRVGTVSMRDFVMLRRMFATADRLLEADFGAIR